MKHSLARYFSFPAKYLKYMFLILWAPWPVPSNTEIVSKLNSNINTGQVGCRLYLSLTGPVFLPKEKHVLFLTGQLLGLISAMMIETNGQWPINLAWGLTQGMPQPPHWDCPSKGIAGCRMTQTPPSSWAAPQQLQTQGKARLCKLSSQEQWRQASPWLIKCSPTRNRVSRQFFTLTKFNGFNFIVSAFSNGSAFPSSPPPSSQRTLPSILPTAKAKALQGETHISPFCCISFKSPSWEELRLSLKRVKCSYLLHFFPQNETNSRYWPCIFPPNNLSLPKAEIKMHIQTISLNALRIHVWRHAFINNLL